MTDSRTPGEWERLAIRVFQGDGLTREERECISAIVRAQSAEPVAELIEPKNADFGDMRIRFIKIRIGVDTPMPEGTQLYASPPALPEPLAESVRGEQTCHRCRAPNPVWFAPSPLWNECQGEFDVLCPICFIDLAAAKGHTKAAWFLTPEFYAAPPAPPEGGFSLDDIATACANAGISDSKYESLRLELAAAPKGTPA